MDRDRLYLHWKCEGYKYVLFGILALIGLAIFGVAHHSSEDRKEKLAEAKSWRQVEATVISAQLSEINTSDETSFSTTIGAIVVFEYQISDEVIRGTYRRQWGRTDLRIWSDFLRPGRKLLIRVSDDDPKVVSLVDYNGRR